MFRHGELSTDMDADLQQLALELGQLLSRNKLTMVSAESCTGGWIAKTMTDIAGSSAWFERGYVTYSDAAKISMLEVNETVLGSDGAVSRATVMAMTVGALKNSAADCAVAVTGIAGPDGGTGSKPVGTVWIAWLVKNNNEAICFNFEGDRAAVRRQSVIAALNGLKERLA